jgi:hypothetical protein
MATALRIPRSISKVLKMNTAGAGFELNRDPFIHITGHAGGVWGYSSYFGFEKECHYGVVIMRNYNWGVTSWDIGTKVLLRKLMESEKKRM